MSSSTEDSKGALSTESLRLLMDAINGKGANCTEAEFRLGLVLQDVLLERRYDQ